MTLEDLLCYNDIVIQCHDDPDADAIASGYALLKYLESKGKSPRLVYSGGRKVTKNNLLLMIEKLNIPLEYVRKTDDETELLITVDCRAGQRNVSALPHQTLVVIDHHELDMGEVLPELCEVRTDCSACVTVIWAMLKKAGFPIEDRLLSTALYYGLYMDTQKFKGTEKLDREMLDALRFDWDIVLLLQSAALALDDFRIAGSAFMNLRYHPEYHFALAPVNTSEPYMLGIVSDMMMDVQELDVCAAYCLLEKEQCVIARRDTGEKVFVPLAQLEETVKRLLDAVHDNMYAMALKNLMGLVCDPIAGLVEVPCVKRNVIGAMDAMSAAQMALAGIESRVPPDQVLDAMAEVGQSLPHTLRETGKGGLAATPFGLEYAPKEL